MTTTRIFTPRLLKTLRDVQVRFMNDETDTDMMCTIIYPAQRAEVNRSADGSPKASWDAGLDSTEVVSVCRVSQLGTPAEIQTDSGEVQTSTHSITFPYGTNVSVNDTILFGGETYLVIGVDRPKTIETATRCFCTKSAKELP